GQGRALLRSAAARASRANRNRHRDGSSEDRRRRRGKLKTMDPLFIDCYERELKHVREMSGEFARSYPKIAARLGLDAFGCADPYVERLIEAFAFMTARIQLKLRSAHGEFSEHLLQLLHPEYMAPTPSMAVMQFIPSHREGSLEAGAKVPRGSAVLSEL